MPLHRYEGQDVGDLERAVAEVEAGKGRVIQVVGQMAGAWWLLVEKPAVRKPAGQRETRPAK